MALSIKNQKSVQRPAERGPAKWTLASRAQLANDIVAAHELCQRAIQGDGKDYLRAIHCLAREQGETVRTPHKLLGQYERHQDWFRIGRDIEVSQIRPRLKLVETPTDEQLWTLARTCWSMPYSKGYGRRLRFLVLDEAHHGLIGILGLQSPPADLACRDGMFKYPRGRKLRLVNQTMDAYTVGAIPPYSFLLGGKLCAGLLASDDVRRAYWRRYAAKRTLIDAEIIGQPLVAITTTSAFGRSSIYNRLRFGPRQLARSIGYTQGFGMLHLEHLYPRIADFLQSEGILTPNGYGHGPKVRWQNVTKALQLLQLPKEFLAHGLQREVFLFELVENLQEGMSGNRFGSPRSMPVEEYSQYWLERWAIPRAQRFPHWNTVNAKDLVRAKVADWAAMKAHA